MAKFSKFVLSFENAPSISVAIDPLALPSVVAATVAAVAPVPELVAYLFQLDLFISSVCYFVCLYL